MISNRLRLVPAYDPVKRPQTPTNTALDGALTASDRKFELYQLQEQGRIAQRATDDIAASLQKETEDTAKQVELLKTAIDALSESTKIQTDASNAIAENAQSLIGDQTKAITAVRDSINELSSRFQVVTDTVNRAFGRGQNHSAGGKLGRQLANGEYVTGDVWATGDYKMVTLQIINVAGTDYWGVPAGWLPCNGTYVDVGSYPELASVIGVTFGAFTNGGASFKLPAKTDLTADATVLANGSLQFLVRT